MSEIKRVTLVDAPDDQTANSTKNVSASKSIRFDFKLFEPTADSFPEFNYSKLLHAEKKKQKKIVKKVNGFSDPFEENDDDVSRMAKEFERKYGTTCASKKKRSNNNYCDKGAGYDENDDFIDNSEAYDELIPDEIETVRGGFYINSGALEFKNLPNFERPEDAARMPKAKKRPCSSSDESSSSGNDENSKRERSAKNGPNEKKPKLSDKDKHKNKEKKIKTKEKKDDGGGSDSEKDGKKVVKTTTVKDMLRAKRDSMRNMIDNGSKSEQTEDSNKDTSSSEDSSDSSEEVSDGIEKKEPDSVPIGDVKLPDNLPTELVENIKKITEASKGSSAGKNNFFDTNNMNLLFEIDTAARVKGGAVRNQIYTYLEKYLPYTKQTILARAKKIRSQKEEAKTNKFVKKLKLAVGIVMPDLLNNYETECKRVTELKNANAMINGGKPEQPIKNPKKRFVWTDSLRHILCEIISSREQSYVVIKPRKETQVDFVNRYLREHVLKIWPDGWMKIDDLQKEYEKRQGNAVKKPKENKKPIESALHQPTLDSTQHMLEATTPTSNNPTITNNNVISSVKPHSTLISEVKSILSNNSIVPNLKETSVTVIPSGKPDEIKLTNSGADAIKTATSPTPSFGSNLTITPIGVNDKMTSKPLANVQNQVTITNVDSSPQPSKVLVTTPAITQHSNKHSVKDSSIAKSTSTTNSGHTMNQATTKLSTKTPPLPADLLSPPKKATDHSINSIISSTAPVNSHSNKTENSKSIDLASQTGGTTTRIINLDNLTKNDILSTAAAQTNVTGGEPNIRIKSVENLNNSVEKNPSTIPTKSLNSTKEKDITSKKTHSHSSTGPSTAVVQKPSASTVSKSSNALESVPKATTVSAITTKVTAAVNQKTDFSNQKPKVAVPHTTQLSIQKPISDKAAPVSLLQPLELSSDSDDVEFVSETQPKKVKKPLLMFKQFKKSNSSSRSSSPGLHAQSSQSSLLSNRRRDSLMDGKDDLDVKGIFEAIKELQEMQTTGVHSSGSNSSHNKKSIHHSSSLPYNKKLDHLEHTSQLSKSSS